VVAIFTVEEAVLVVVVNGRARFWATTVVIWNVVGIPGKDDIVETSRLDVAEGATGLWATKFWLGLVVGVVATWCVVEIWTAVFVLDVKDDVIVGSVVIVVLDVKDDVIVGSVVVARVAVVVVAQPCTPQERDLAASGGVARWSVSPPPIWRLSPKVQKEHRRRNPNNVWKKKGKTGIPSKGETATHILEEQTHPCFLFVALSAWVLATVATMVAS
jgi:hypothetical protein